MKTLPYFLVVGQASDDVANYIADQKKKPYLRRVPLSQRAAMGVIAFAFAENAHTFGKSLGAKGVPYTLGITKDKLPLLIPLHSEIKNCEWDRSGADRVDAQIAELNWDFRLSHAKSIGTALNRRDLPAAEAASLFNRALYWTNGARVKFLPDLDWPAPWALQVVIENGAVVGALHPDEQVIIQTDQRNWVAMPVQDWWLAKLGAKDLDDLNWQQFETFLEWTSAFLISRAQWECRD